MLISGFARELASYVEGTPNDDGIHQSIRPFIKRFLSEIRESAPKFFPFVLGQAQEYAHPMFPPSNYEPKIHANDDGVIFVDEVSEMGDK